MLELGQSSALNWFKRYHFLYIYAFLINFRPMKPFLHDYLSETRNLTDTYILQDVYPMVNYSAAISSFLLFLGIGFCTLSYTFIPLSLSAIVVSVYYAANPVDDDNGFSLLFVQGASGIFQSAEIFLFVSIFLVKDRKTGLELCSEIRGSALLGTMFSALFGHTVVVQGWLGIEIYHLAAFTAAAAVHAAILIIHFPLLEQDKNPPQGTRKRTKKIAQGFYAVLKNFRLLRMCLWYAVALCGLNLISVYIQFLWKAEEAKIGNDLHSNGAVEAALALLSFLAVLVAGRTKFNKKYTDVVMCLALILQTVSLVVISGVKDVLSTYICYMLYGMVFYYTTTLVCAEIAQKTPDKSSIGVVFGFVNFLAMVFNVFVVCIANLQVVETADPAQRLFVCFWVSHLAAGMIFAGFLVIASCSC